MNNGMKKSRMKKNSTDIIKAEADRSKMSWDVKDNGKDSNGQTESFKTFELMYCLAHLIYNAHFCGIQRIGEKSWGEPSRHSKDLLIDFSN